MTRSTSVEAPRLARGRPEPSSFWIRYWPRSWSGPEGSWVHLATGRLGETIQGSLHCLDAALPGCDDLLYLPPVPPGQGEDRDRLARRAVEEGVPVLIQLQPGEGVPGVPAIPVYDPTDLLLRGEIDRLEGMTGDTAVVWPLIPGLTDRPEVWQEGCRRLAAAGVACVQPMDVALTPFQRRRLAEGEAADGVFEALFHRPAPTARAFARVAHRWGLRPFLERPPRPGVDRLAKNREIGGALSLAGELWLRLGRPVAAGQGFFRAARWVEETRYDLEALAREDNLGLIERLEGPGRRLVEEWIAAGESALLKKLLAEYVEGEPE